MIFVRHGQSTSNAVFYRTGRDPGIVDPELTEVGRHQAEFAAWRLSRLGVRRIITSPYKRALQTAEIIAARTGALVIVDPLVGERAIMPWEIGSPRAEIERRFPGVVLDHLPEFWWPQPEESESKLYKRCVEFCKKAAKMEGLQKTVIVTHWGFIRALTGAEVPNCTIVPFNAVGGGATTHQKQLAPPVLQ